MSAVVFLTVERVIELHGRTIELHGGEHGLRDRGGLESAVHMPQAGIAGQLFHETIHAMAAAYLYHIVQNHPFIDGNKRAGLAAALVFLGVNGCRFTGDEDETRDMVLRVACGQMQKEEITIFFENNTSGA